MTIVKLLIHIDNWHPSIRFELVPTKMFQGEKFDVSSVFPFAEVFLNLSRARIYHFVIKLKL